jgi:ubiquinone/menaquinone biosynthesis C-methylase UbiE
MSLDKLEKTEEGYKKHPKLFSQKREYPWPELIFLFDDYLKKGERVLDLGCGNGRFFQLVKDKGAVYLGLDSSPGLIAIARERYPQAYFQVADVLNLQLPDNDFDKVYLIALLHHFPTPLLRNQCLREAKRVLKNKGLLFLTVWSPHLKQRWSLSNKKLFFKNLFLKLTGRLGWSDSLRPLTERGGMAYYHFFSQKELTSLLKKQGFKIIETGITSDKKHNRRNFYLIAQK